jgi:WhiB family transcriptional regulator, redox-sensing transcriptional regulator
LNSLWSDITVQGEFAEGRGDVTDVQRLPGPQSDKWDWQLRGACRGTTGEVFFHPEGERGTARSRREEAAKAICATCPVVCQCALHALRVREPYGVWGGLSESERENVLSELGGRALAG